MGKTGLRIRDLAQPVNGRPWSLAMNRSVPAACFWLALVCLPATPASAAATASFESQLLTLGHARLTAPEMGRSDDFLKELGVLTGFEVAEVRSNLLALTDSLEVRRKGKTADWEALLALRPEGVEKREAEDFLKHLLKESRKLVKEEEESRSLGAAIKKAGRRAQLSYDGQALLLDLIGEPSRRSAPGQAADRKVGILVDARPVPPAEGQPPRGPAGGHAGAPSRTGQQLLHVLRSRHAAGGPRQVG